MVKKVLFSVFLLAIGNSAFAADIPDKAPVPIVKQMYKINFIAQTQALAARNITLNEIPNTIEDLIKLKGSPFISHENYTLIDSELKRLTDLNNRLNDARSATTYDQLNKAHRGLMDFETHNSIIGLRLREDIDKEMVRINELIGNRFTRRRLNFDN